MDKKSKIIIALFFIVIFIVSAMSFYKVLAQNNYYVKMETDCDPEKEKCFIKECNPEEDSERPENQEERISYSKIINKKASAIPACDSKNETCLELNCEGDRFCQETFCDEKNVEKGETCNDPEAYIKAQEEKNTSSEEGCDNESADCTGSGGDNPEESQDGL